MTRLPAGRRRRRSSIDPHPAPTHRRVGDDDQLRRPSISTMAAAAAARVATALCLLAVLAGGASRQTACQDDFLIREGTIIRTVDSRRRGAAFLNISEVAETSRCLQACCDRTGCNAAIYDQKTRSCFLFDCGPLDDYRCLFTAHTQFVSATLRVSRSQLDLAQWGSQSQHEAELTSLKNVDTASVPKPVEHHKTLERPLKEIIRPPATSAPPVTKAPTPRCSRFQFECHSGECLAIYNACDGIPQCEDGSDEGAELDCPGVSKQDRSEATARPPVANSDTKDAARHPQVAPPPRGPQEPARQGSDEPGSGWERPRYNQGYSEVLPPGDIFNHRQQGLLTGLSHFPAAVASTHPHHSVQQQQVNFPPYEKPPPVYQPQPVFYDDVYQNWAGRVPSGYPYDAAPRYDMLPPPPQRAPFAESPPLQLPPGGAQTKLAQAAPQAPWPEQQPSRETNPAPDRPESSEDRPLSVDRRPTPLKTPEKPNAATPTANNTTNNATVAPDSEKQAETTTKAATSPQAVTKAASPVVDEVEFSLSELRAQAALQSSESQGAAIVLTLGILLSAILVVLALCRMQCVRQQTKRGDRPGLAHDADYLVNGMYL